MLNLYVSPKLIFSAFFIQNKKYLLTTTSTSQQNIEIFPPSYDHAHLSSVHRTQQLQFCFDNYWLGQATICLQLICMGEHGIFYEGQRFERKLLELLQI